MERCGRCRGRGYLESYAFAERDCPECGGHGFPTPKIKADSGMADQVRRAQEVVATWPKWAQRIAKGRYLDGDKGP